MRDVNGCRMDKDLQAVRLVLQNEIGAAADDDAGAFFGELRDDLVLVIPQNIFVGGAEHPVGKAAERKLLGTYSPASFT